MVSNGRGKKRKIGLLIQRNEPSLKKKHKKQKTHFLFKKQCLIDFYYKKRFFPTPAYNATMK